MIFGIGCDIAQISRFGRWLDRPGMISRFFNERELFPREDAARGRMLEWYAARFAAKEAFSKALGTGFSGFKLADIYIEKNCVLHLENFFITISFNFCHSLFISNSYFPPLFENQHPFYQKHFSQR